MGRKIHLQPTGFVSFKFSSRIPGCRCPLHADADPPTTYRRFGGNCPLPCRGFGRGCTRPLLRFSMTILRGKSVKPSRDIARLIEIMAALRTPGSGCPWDLQQTFQTIAPYTLEEAYEVADAIARGNLADLKDELGDLLLQVAFHARMAEEKGAFDFADVVEAITSKLIRRHPHVFADAEGRTAEAVEGLWERIKA